MEVADLKNTLISGILLLIRLWQKARMRSRSTRSYFLIVAFAGSLTHLSLLVIGIKQDSRKARSNSPKTYYLRALSLSIDRIEVRIASPRTPVPSSLILFVDISVVSVTATAIRKISIMVPAFTTVTVVWNRGKL